jgi:hypothetical protein
VGGWGVTAPTTPICGTVLHSAGMRAMWGMLSKCGTLDNRSLEVQVQLFDALGAPVLGYCSEVRACPSLVARASVKPED